MKLGSYLILNDIDAEKLILVPFNKLHNLVVSQEMKSPKKVLRIS